MAYHEDLVERADAVAASSLLLWERLKRDLLGSDDPDALLDTYLFALLGLVLMATDETYRWSRDLALLEWPRLAGAPTFFPLVDAALLDEAEIGGRARMEAALRDWISAMRARARQLAALTGRTYGEELRSVVESRQAAYNIRKMLDEAVVNSAQHSLWMQGLGHFENKRVVGVVDKDQTPLCRRLNGTVWRWDEPVVDPVSGGSRMFPPFVGPRFDPQFHFCRSVCLPAE